MLRRFGLELLLILSAASLVGQLAWPALVRWWWLPGSGHIGVDHFDSTNGLSADYAIYLPHGYGEKPKLWPLIVFLHGSGERGSDATLLFNWGPLYSVQNGCEISAIVVAPQCPAGGNWQSDTTIRFIESVSSKYRIDRARIYLVGYSMGAFGAWRLASEYPDHFAALVPISGGGDTTDAKSAAAIPTWAFHGAEDEVIPLSASERMIEAVRAVDGTPRLTILPKASHDICSEVCVRSDLWEWVFAQRRTNSVTDSPETRDASDH